MIGHFEIKPEYIYSNDPFLQDILKLSGLPVEWEYCKRLEELDLVTLLNRCDLKYQYPHDMRIRRMTLEKKA